MFFAHLWERFITYRIVAGCDCKEDLAAGWKIAAESQKGDWIGAFIVVRGGTEMGVPNAHC